MRNGKKKAPSMDGAVYSGAIYKISTQPIKISKSSKTFAHICSGWQSKAEQTEMRISPSLHHQVLHDGKLRGS